MNRILAVIITAGVGFRAMYAGSPQLATEELMQARILRAGSFSEMLRWMREGLILPAPLDIFVQRGFSFVFGESTWALRAHAVIFGGLSLFVFYRIARLLFGDRVALYSTGLLAVYPLHYHYSQEALPTSLLFLLTLVSFDLILQRQYGRVRGLAGWPALLLVHVLMLYTSPFALPIIAAQVVIVCSAAFLRGGRSRGISPSEEDVPSVRPADVVVFFLVASIAFGLYLPWIGFAGLQPGVAAIGDLVNYRIPLRVFREIGDGSYLVSALLLAGAIAGFRAMRKHGRRHASGWLTLWLVLPIPFAFVFDAWAGNPFAVRQILPAMPALLLLAGYGLSYVGERMTVLEALPYQLSSPAMVYAALLFVSSCWIAWRHWNTQPVDWRGTAAFLEQSASPGDLMTIPRVYPLLEYYSPRLARLRMTDLDPGMGSLNQDGVQRRVVVCFDGMHPDPCRGFREAAEKDSQWARRGLRGFTIFTRSR